MTPPLPVQHTSIFARLRRVLADSAWASVAGKFALYALGLVALALVGSGKLFAKNARPEEVASAHAVQVSAAAPSIAPPRDAGVADADPSAGPVVTEDGKVAINRATERDLRRLPGVGATKAKAILALRDKLGKFKKAEDLLRIKGMGRRSLARIKPLIIID